MAVQLVSSSSSRAVSSRGRRIFLFKRIFLLSSGSKIRISCSQISSSNSSSSKCFICSSNNSSSNKVVSSRGRRILLFLPLPFSVLVRVSISMSIGVLIDITVVVLVSYYKKSASPTTYISAISISADSDVISTCFTDSIISRITLQGYH